MAEFIYNNAQTSTTGITPFFANYGYHPLSYNPQTTNTYPVNPASKLYTYWMIGIYDQARKDLEVARKRIKDWADKKRKNPPAFAIGQLVMLNMRNIKTKRLAKKLDKKMLGPFWISKVISPNAMRLTLPTK